MNNINISKRYRTNPFIEDLKIETATKRIVVSPLGKGSNILVNQKIGEQQGTEVTTYKKVDNQEFIKLFVNNIALTFELHSYGIKAFNVVMWAMQYSGINKDLIVLDTYTLESFLNKNFLKMSIPTFRRGLNELVHAKIIAKSIRKGWYFINPSFMFNGDRIAFTTLIERDKFEAENTYLDIKENISEVQIELLKLGLVNSEVIEIMKKYSSELIQAWINKLKWHIDQDHINIIENQSKWLIENIKLEKLPPDN